MIEKPFGVNLASAERLDADLRASGWREEEVYRVDHYLGKPLLASVPAFRRANPQLDRLLNGGCTRSLEVGFQERLHLQGRTRFYDKVGVLRDVLQNHATEMLLSVLSELAAPSELAVEKARRVALAKLVALRGLCPVVEATQLLLGQYAEYGAHLRADTSRYTSRTPTFAAVALSACEPRWRGASILLTAGRQLRRKASFVRLRMHSPDHVATDDPARSLHLNPGLGVAAASRHGRTVEEPVAQLLLLVDAETSSADLPSPAIVCSSVLKCRAADGLELHGRNLSLSSALLDGAAPNERFDVFRLRPALTARQPYAWLLAEAVAGRRESFVSWPVLRESWRLWDRVLRLAADTPLRTYAGGGDGALQLVWRDAPQWLAWADAAPLQAPPPPNVGLLLGVPMFTAAAPLLDSRLADSVLAEAHSILQSEPFFHLVLPGGASAQELMLQLAARSHRRHGANQRLLDWSRVHLWLADERCTARGAADSNAVTLEEMLVRRLAQVLPLRQLHSLLLPSAGRFAGVCLPDAAADYQAELEHHLGRTGRLHFVVLGVGADGHVASLFPGSPLLADDEQQGPLVDAVVAPRPRVTLTPRALASASHVTLLLKNTGHGKVQLLSRLLEWQAHSSAHSARDLPLRARRELPVLHAMGWHTNVTLWVDAGLLRDGQPAP